jgi:hypothetical protein
VLALGACHHHGPLSTLDGAPTGDGDAGPSGDAEPATDAASGNDASTTSDADAADTADADLCAVPAPDDPRLSITAFWDGVDGTYVGAATVERSAPEGLVLALVDALPMTSFGVPHVVIGGAPAPSLPIGGRVWLNRAISPVDTFGRGPVSSAFVVRDHENGTILFGAANQGLGEVWTPFTLGALMPLCSSGDCPRTASLALGVPDGTPPFVPSGGSTTVPVGAHSYRLWMEASPGSVDADTCQLTNLGSPLLLDLTYEATELAALGAGLDIVALPTCHEGNDPAVDVVFTLVDAPNGPTYDGPAVYRGREGGAVPHLAFDLPGPPGAPSLDLDVSTPSLFAEPKIGDKFWLTTDGAVGMNAWTAGALRKTKGGPLLLASAHVTPGEPTADVELRIQQVVGFQVVFQVGCALAPYGNDALYTAEIVFLTHPQPARVDSGSTGLLSIDTVPYHAWVWGIANTSATFVIWPSATAH